jgi:hypothetical protein
MPARDRIHLFDTTLRARVTRSGTAARTRNRKNSRREKP